MRPPFIRRIPQPRLARDLRLWQTSTVARAWPLLGFLAFAGCAGDEGRSGGGDSDSDADADSDSDADGDCNAEGFTRVEELDLAVRETRITLASALGPGPIFAAPDGEGTVVGWAAGGGSIHLTSVDGGGSPAGEDLTLAGDEIHGLAPTDDGIAALVFRQPDIISFVKVDRAGAPLFDELQLGGGDQGVTGNEWWQTIWFMGEGRLLWTGSQYAAYFQVRRLWEDGIAHVGDTMRWYGADGASADGGWGWGCSHSMDQRLAISGDRVGAVCVSDCYPGQGMYFDHTTEILLEPGGDCAGQIGATLGGLAPVADGFWLAWGSSAGRDGHDVALVHVGLDGTVGTISHLTETAGENEDAIHLAPIGTGLLAGWRRAGVQRVARLDASGAIEAEVESVLPSFRDHDDWFARPGGDVGWVRSDAADSVGIVRVRDCR